jgi:hypothetical protein
VSIATVRQVWRDTTVAMCGISSFYEAFFPLVRHLNQALPKEQRFRVVAADPPVDWSAGEPATVLRGVDRDGSIATVMTAEVLAKKHKALMLVGTGHLFHNERSRGTAVSAYERTYPGKTFVIETHNGFAAFFDLDRGRQLEARMRSWPIPSIALLEGTWLAQLDLPYFFWPFPRRMAGQRIAELADAYLYLGPGASLTYEKTPTAILDSQSYAAELSRRFHLDVDVLRKRNEDPHLYTLEDRAEARRFAPGVELVGEYAKSPDGAPLVEIDFRDGQLSAKVGSSAWAPLTTDGTSARYRTVGADGNNVFEFDMSGGTVSGLSLTRGSDAVRTRLVRISQ